MPAGAGCVRAAFGSRPRACARPSPGQAPDGVRSRKPQGRRLGLSPVQNPAQTLGEIQGQILPPGCLRRRCRQRRSGRCLPGGSAGARRPARPFPACAPPLPAPACLSKDEFRRPESAQGQGKPGQDAWRGRCLPVSACPDAVAGGMSLPPASRQHAGRRR